eukprot:1507764-Pleurochrysis_carterae.AAC.3
MRRSYLLQEAYPCRDIVDIKYSHAFTNFVNRASQLALEDQELLLSKLEEQAVAPEAEIITEVTRDTHCPHFRVIQNFNILHIPLLTIVVLTASTHGVVLFANIAFDAQGAPNDTFYIIKSGTVKVIGV